MHRSTRAAFFSSIHLCTCMKEHLVHACLYELYPRVFLEQEVLCVHEELNAVEIARIVCVHITTHDFQIDLLPYVTQHALCTCYGMCWLIWCMCFLLYVLLNILYNYAFIVHITRYAQRIAKCTCYYFYVC